MHIHVTGEFTADEVALIEQVANATEAEVRTHLPDLDSNLRLNVRTGSYVIPETGDVGGSVAYGVVDWCIDPTRAGGVAAHADRNLRHTLFHELHHQVRGWVMYGGPSTTNFMDGVLSEGMATAFARDAAGDHALWASYPDDVDSWIDELLALPVDANYASWMFQHPDGRRNIGYRAGTAIIDRATASSGWSAADLVHTSTAEVLGLAGLAPVG